MCPNSVFIVRFRFIGRFYETAMLNYVYRLMKACLLRDEYGYYTVGFPRMRDAKRFVRYMLFRFRYGFCLRDVCIIPSGFSYYLEANFRLPFFNKPCFLFYKKVRL